MPAAYKVWHQLSPILGRNAIPIERSDGFVERSGISLVHFLKQQAYITQVPSIYHPHDLQHVHFPKLFSPRELQFRRFKYKTFCDQARLVVTSSSWAKADIIRNLELRSEKVVVVPLAPPLSVYPVASMADLHEAMSRLNLPSEFVYYPANTWPHKNHIGLLEAIAILRDRYNTNISLVSSGRLTEHYAKIKRCIKRLNLESRVRFVGFVSEKEMRCLYTLCKCVAIPTKFEAASFPMWEAFSVGRAVACSNVTSLPAQGGDAVMLFDAEDSEEIASCLLKLWMDKALRDMLVEVGKKRVAAFTWEHTAKMFRAYYRQILNRSLTSDDRALLAEEPRI
jgi:glycosyltransferase involved in cell wall biosynthesis